MLLRRIARPLLAGVFVQGGIDELRQLEPRVERARPVVGPLAEKAPEAEVLPQIGSPPVPATLVKLNAAVQIGAGTMLALGKAPRLAAIALAASLVPTTVAAHAFWNEQDKTARSQQRTQFLKNLGLLGGLMIAAADTAGKPSLAWRGKRAARLAAAEAERKVAESSGTVSGKTVELAGRTSEVVGKASGAASTLAGVAAGSVSALAARASAAGSQLTREAERKATKLQRRTTKRASKLRSRAAKKAAKLSEQANARVAALTDLAASQAVAFTDRAESPGRSATGARDDLAGKAASLGGAVSGAAKAASGKVKALAR